MNARSVWNSPFSWLVRREIWEHRLIVGGPGVLFGVIALSAIIALLNAHPVSLSADVSGLDLGPIEAPARKLQILMIAFILVISALFLILASGIQIFYAADTLHAERSQRTILFWKSLPVSDLSTVLAKVVVAALVIPLVALVAGLATTVILSLLLTVEAYSLSNLLAAVWSPTVWWHAAAVLLYLTLTATVWFLPMTTWFLLVSAWLPLARGRLGRSPMLVAVVVPALVVVFEAVAFHSFTAGAYLARRFGFAQYLSTAFAYAQVTTHAAGDIDSRAIGSIASDVMSPLTFLGSPSTLLGVLVSALFIAGAVYSRRRSEDRA